MTTEREMPLSSLTTKSSDAIDDNMDAVLLEQSKQVFADGSISEIVIWKVPRPVPGCVHYFKYRLYFGRDGKRIVGFDNERGKGDHCHLDGKETPYQFTTSDALLMDFSAEVSKRRRRE